MTLFALATVGRPWVNFGEGLAFEFSERAYDALEENDYPRTAELCQKSLELDDDQWHCWYNLGIAEWNLDRQLTARTAFQRAYDLEPDDPDTRDSLIELTREIAQNASETGRLSDAAAWYGEIRELDGMDAADWFELGRANKGLNRSEEARNAFSEAVALEPENEEYRSALMAITEGAH